MGSLFFPSLMSTGLILTVSGVSAVFSGSAESAAASPATVTPPLPPPPVDTQDGRAKTAHIIHAGKILKTLLSISFSLAFRAFTLFDFPAQQFRHGEINMPEVFSCQGMMHCVQ
jgi:hypothetical protein